ncbi:MAG: OsmC family protein [Alkalibacterium sp.]|nr:OsmC family protein [Alkalibacterium sp.]
MDKALFEATIHNTDGVDGTAFVEGPDALSVKTSHPLDNSSGTNPEELFGLAMTTCLNATIQSLLKARGFQNRSKVSANVQLRREADGVGYYFQVDLFASIEDMDLDQAELIVQSAEKRCPVSKLTRGSQTIDIKTIAYEQQLDN